MFPNGYIEGICFAFEGADEIRTRLEEEGYPIVIELDLDPDSAEWFARNEADNLDDEWEAWEECEDTDELHIELSSACLFTINNLSFETEGCSLLELAEDSPLSAYELLRDALDNPDDADDEYVDEFPQYVVGGDLHSTILDPTKVIITLTNPASGLPRPEDKGMGSESLQILSFMVEPPDLA